jgi:hypothetical protein
VSKKTVTHASTETSHAGNTAMPTKSHSHHETTTAQPKETTAMSIEQAPVQPSTHPAIAAEPSPAPAPALARGGAVPAPAPVPSVGPPPAGANIPIPPTGFTPATPGEFRSVVPRKPELAAMPQALIDLAKFTDFDKLFGGVGLAQAETMQCLLMGSLWSTMRASTSQWDAYSVLQEGYAWRAIRAALLRLEQAFLLAAQANPALATTYPGLAALLGARKSIAQKGAATRRLNKAAKAKGEPEIHGLVGKQRQRKAEKAALAQGGPATQAAPAAVVVAPPAAGPAPANGGGNSGGH